MSFLPESTKNRDDGAKMYSIFGLGVARKASGQPGGGWPLAFLRARCVGSAADLDGGGQEEADAEGEHEVVGELGGACGGIAEFGARVDEVAQFEV